MTRKTMHMETTDIAPAKSAAEIIAELVSAGANQINQTFEGGRIIGIRWVMRVGAQDILFDMPVRVEPFTRYSRNGPRVRGFRISRRKRCARRPSG